MADQNNAKIEVGGVDSEEFDAVVKAMTLKEQAPTTAESTLGGVDWKAALNVLGDPFDFSRIPVTKRTLMRYDPMISFGLHFSQVPLATAEWHVNARDKNGPNAQVAAFMDSAWRKIHAAFVFQKTIDQSMGASPIVKRFMYSNPGGLYVDTQEADPAKQLKPAWDEGEVLPLNFKTFVALELTRCEPMFNDQTGEFAGINYTPPATTQTNPGFKAKRSQKNQKNTREIDIYHSLWTTNEKYQHYNSLWGYPRTGRAYPYWWSYWFRWAMSDRAFERFAVPPMLARHPVGNTWDSDEQRNIPNWQIAIQACEALRSNAIAAAPSTLQTAGLDGSGASQYAWNFEFVMPPSMESFRWMDESFNYLDVMKLRALFVPEQGFIEGEGGTSSRNVATAMFEVFNRSQKLDWDDIVDHVERFVFPHLLIANFPEFVNNGGVCKIVGHGFKSNDMELLKQLIQLLGQADPNSLGIDIRTMLSREDIPLKTPEEMERERQSITGRPTAPPAVEPGRTTVGVVPVNGTTASGQFPAGSTNGGSVAEPASVTGFSFDDNGVAMVYIQPGEYITLSDDADFLTELPDSKHYKDKAMKALAAQLRRSWSGYLRMLYPAFARFVSTQEAWQFADEDEVPKRGVSQAAARRAVKAIMDAWKVDEDRLNRQAAGTRKILTRILKRSIALENQRLNMRPEEEPSEADFEPFLNEQVSRLMAKTHKTVRDEFSDFLVNEIRDGKDPRTAADNLAEHYAEFPGWKSNRIGRAETRDTFNAGNLLAAEALKIKYAKASDGEQHDEDCKKRNGKLVTIKQAWKWLRDEHPNGTLAFDPIPRANFSIKYVNKMDMADQLAYFDDESSTAFILADAPGEDIEEFLSRLGTALLNGKAEAHA